MEGQTEMMTSELVDETVKQIADLSVNDPQGEEPQGEDGDIMLDCRDCSEKFLFTVGEQEFYAQKGFEGQPSRCKDCRAKKKAQYNSYGGRGNNVCYAFQRGECQRGESCKFSHTIAAPDGGGVGGVGGGFAGGKSGGRRGVCFAFGRGECTRGDDCRYSHDPNAAQDANESGAGRRSGGGDRKCFAFAKGECTYGDLCKFSHEL